MPFTAMITKAVGDPVIAADWNTYLRDNVSYLKDVLSGVNQQAVDIRNNLTVGQAGGGEAFELGTSTAAGATFIDFHSAGLSEDFNFRVISSGGSSESGSADVTLAAKLFSFYHSTDTVTTLVINSSGPQYPTGSYMLAMKSGPKRRVEVGLTTFGTINAASQSSAAVSFVNAYNSGTPRVVATIDGTMANAGVTVAGITTTGFALYVYNNSAVAITPSVNWVAVGSDV